MTCKTCQFNDNGYCEKFDDDMASELKTCTEYMEKPKKLKLRTCWREELKIFLWGMNFADLNVKHLSKKLEPFISQTIKQEREQGFQDGFMDARRRQKENDNIVNNLKK